VKPKILIVDDSVETAQLLREGLRKRNYDAEDLNSAKACLERLRFGQIDIILTDFQMPEMNGVDLCRAVRELSPETLVLVFTGVGGLESAIASIRAGAFDFMTKPVTLDALVLALNRAIDHQAVRRELKRLRTSAKQATLDTMIGSSPAIKTCFELVERVAPSDATVLITGESGTGKELVARALHNQSTRRDKPFVGINCGAIPAPLLESELFGHVRGAFTDARENRAGLFAQAGGGSLFLDEIGEMPMEMQVKLLRVLQERRVRPVGSDHEVPVDCRVITATNRNLEHEVEDKRFRQDLYYRINVVTIPVPPLRDRQNDILLLAQYFLERTAQRNSKPVEGISSGAARMLLDYDWPGNVRELENCMERAVALCRLNEITVEDLPKRIQGSKSKLVVSADSLSEMITLEEMEKRYVRYVLNLYNGNKTHTARALGIDRRSLYRRLAEHFGAEPEPAITDDVGEAGM
jgi:DNA-binding NtrC family response regulator